MTDLCDFFPARGLGAQQTGERQPANGEGADLEERPRRETPSQSRAREPRTVSMKRDSVAEYLAGGHRREMIGV